jgi:hypothetical protein
VAVRRLGQVIQRPEQQHRIGRLSGLGELTRVAQRGGKAGGRIGACCLAGLLHVQRHRMHQMHAVPPPGQRGGIGAWAAAHI